MAFTNPEPYNNVDTSDPMTIGRLMAAAARGDQRAKATLRPVVAAAAADREAAKQEAAQRNAGGVQRGRDLYRNHSGHGPFDSLESTP